MKVRAFASAPVSRRFTRIVRRSGRECSWVARWLIEEAEDRGLLDGLPTGARVEGHRDGRTPPLVFRLPPRTYGRLKDRAGNLGVYQASVSHLLGLCIAGVLELRADREWIEWFADGGDLVERIARSVERSVDPWFLLDWSLHQVSAGEEGPVAGGGSERSERPGFEFRNTPAPTVPADARGPGGRSPGGHRGVGASAGQDASAPRRRMATVELPSRGASGAVRSAPSGLGPARGPGAR